MIQENRSGRLVRTLKSTILTKRTLIILGVIFGVFVILNLAVFVIYRQRPYPDTTVAGARLSVGTGTTLEQTISSQAPLPEMLQLSYALGSWPTKPSDIGIQADFMATRSAVLSRRHAIPVWNLVSSHQIPLQLIIDQARFEQTVGEAFGKHQLPATDARIALSDGTFTITPESDGHSLNLQTAREHVSQAIGNGSAVISLPKQTVPPKIRRADLEAELRKLKRQQQTAVTVSYEAKSKQYSAAEIGDWYAPDGATYILSDDRIRAALVATGSGFGIGVQNIQEAIEATKAAVRDSKAADITLTAIPRPHKSYTYCTSARGVDASELAGLRSKLATVFADARGWGLEGQISYTHGTNGCQFTVWLAAAEQMPTFGAICDPDWSCRVGPNVIINFTRWQHASPAWNAAGGSLDDYRSMVINHETGHFLGFGHPTCPGPGQPAPVMLQQSINLGGCTFNPWPLPSERAVLKTRLGL